MSWDAFTPVASSVGGGLIGLSALWMLAAHGRIAGISGILGTLLTRPRSDSGWRVAFIAGLVVAGLIGHWASPERFGVTESRSLLEVAAAGLIVGIGTRLAGGCTSGHGVCGIGRLSPRSLAATATFMATGALTVWWLRAAGGG